MNRKRRSTRQLYTKAQGTFQKTCTELAQKATYFAYQAVTESTLKCSMCFHSRLCLSILVTPHTKIIKVPCTKIIKTKTCKECLLHNTNVPHIHEFWGAPLLINICTDVIYQVTPCLPPCWKKLSQAHHSLTKVSLWGSQNGPYSKWSLSKWSIFKKNTF